LGCLAGVFAYIPFLLAPGYVAGYASNVFHFREASWSERILLSVTLSMSVTPIVATLVSRFSSLGIACGLFVVLSVLSAVLIVRDPKRASWSQPMNRSTKIGLLLAVGWTCLAIVSLVDVQIGDRLYVPAASFDQSIRSALAGAALRTGVPPLNPFFFPGHGIPLRYYYYWNVLCALPAKLLGLDVRLTTLAGVVWSGLALASLVPLYLKHFCAETIGLRRKSLIGIALLAVTGLDLIPTIIYFCFNRTIFADMEWWDGQQVTSWFDSLLWVPHHVAGLVACLIAFLVLWTVPRNATLGERVRASVLAALGFASAAGLSVYITFTFAIFLMIWVLILLRSKLHADALMFIAVGLIAVTISVGYLHELQQPGYTGSFAQFYVRSLESIEEWTDRYVQWSWLRGLVLALLLPVYYVVELGLFALIGLVQARSYWKRPACLVKWEWAAVVLCGASLLVSSFLMSTTGNNDLGYRGILFAQFILLLWAVPVVDRWKSDARKVRLLLLTFLWIGILGSVYQWIELRTFTMLAEEGTYVEEASWLPGSENLGEDLFLARTGFSTLDQKLPKSAVLQYNPVNPAYVPNVYYARRQTVAGVSVCGTAFGGDPFVCMPLQNKILAAFNGTTAFKMEDANRLCDDLGMDVLIAERSDRMWALKQSWVWSENPLLENEYMRAYACGRLRDQIQAKFEGRRDAN
jgi:hypothetical protein